MRRVLAFGFWHYRHGSQARFTVAGSTAKLAVTSTGSLTSLMNINQVTGVVDNNGVVTSRGDYMNLGGMITGTGRFNAPFFTNVSGMIAPGTTGTIGTLTFGGNLILASASTLLVDVGPSATSDMLAVVKTTTTDGIANVGGRVGFAPVAGHTIRAGDLYTIVTAQGGVTGAFSAPAALSAILTPQFVYSAAAVQARIVAGRYADVVANTAVQTELCAVARPESVQPGELVGAVRDARSAELGRRSSRRSKVSRRAPKR